MLPPGPRFRGLSSRNPLHFPLNPSRACTDPRVHLPLFHRCSSCILDSRIAHTCCRYTMPRPSEVESAGSPVERPRKRRRVPDEQRKRSHQSCDLCRKVSRTLTRPVLQVPATTPFSRANWLTRCISCGSFSAAVNAFHQSLSKAPVRLASSIR